MAYELPTIPASAWNANAHRLARKLNLSLGGRTDANGWRHPWNVKAAFNTFSQRWELNVYPGFINAMETEAPAMDWNMAPPLTRERLPGGAGGRVRPWLSESPWFTPKAWRKIGEDAEPTREPEAVPEFFQAFGVGGPPRLDLNVDFSGVSVSVDPTEDPDARRLLRAVDVVLAVPKPAPALVTTETPNGVRVDVSLNVPGPEEVPSLFTTRRWFAPIEAPTVQEQLASGRTQPTFEEWRVATVFLLSPAGEPAGAEPGSGWFAFTRHSLTWNRGFAYKSEADFLPPLDLTFSTGLAGGIAQPIFDALLAPVNEADRAASLFLSRAAVETDSWSL